MSIKQKNRAAVALGRLAAGCKKTMSKAAIKARKKNAIAGWKTRKAALQ